MSGELDPDVEVDCAVDTSETDLDTQPGYTHGDSIGVRLRGSKVDAVHVDNHEIKLMGVASRRSRGRSSGYSSDSAPDSLKNAQVSETETEKKDSSSFHGNSEDGGAITQITDNLIEDGSHVVFDWDNTLKLYDTKTRQLSSRVDKKFLQHLKNDRHCKLYIISAIRPSMINLSTILCEVERLGLTDLFVNVGFKNADCDQVDGIVEEDRPEEKRGEYARKGNVIICDYQKAETFLKLSSFDASKGEKVVLFDDESVNIETFRMIVPNSTCYLCE